MHLAGKNSSVASNWFKTSNNVQTGCYISSCTWYSPQSICKTNGCEDAQPDSSHMQARVNRTQQRPKLPFIYWYCVNMCVHLAEDALFSRKSQISQAAQKQNI
ncbi:hypothetical protein VTK73DRAFT_3948 [Phialemonium thermophilum]|uniref:Uncharacterized protein n=1 Tax=Phialemonium thermophilum TaxID=223376 RepID=A0ABR3Y0F7_9PEZI